MVFPSTTSLAPWKVTVDFHNIMPDMAFLLKQITMAFDMWYAVFHLVCAFFSVSENKEGKKQFTIISFGWRSIFTCCPGILLFI